MKAGGATWAWFVVALLLAIAVVAIVRQAELRGVIEPGSGRGYVGIGIVVMVLPVCGLAYRLGSYRTSD